MRHILISSLLLATALSAAAPTAARVVAVSDDVSLTPPAEGLNYALRSPDVTAAALGEFVVAWSANSTLYQGSHPVGLQGGLLGRKVGVDAQPLGPEFPIVPIGDTLDAESPRIAGNASGRFVVAWELTVIHGNDFRSFRTRNFLRFRPFDAEAEPAGPEVHLYASGPGQFELGPGAYGAVALDPAGRSLAAWLQPLSFAGQGSLYTVSFDPSGRAVTLRSPVSSTTGRGQSAASPAATMDGRGDSILVYQRAGGGLYLRRYDPRGRSLGGEVQIAATRPAGDPSVAANPDGRFVVAWADTSLGIEAQLFTAAGQPDGPPFQVSGNTRAVAIHDDVAMDSRGDFVVVWEAADADLGASTLLGRAYRGRVPEGNEFVIPASGTLNAPFGDTTPTVALAEDGTFLVTWAADLIDPPNQISARAFRLVPDVE